MEHFFLQQVRQNRLRCFAQMLCREMEFIANCGWDVSLACLMQNHPIIGYKVLVARSTHRPIWWISAPKRLLLVVALRDSTLTMDRLHSVHGAGVRWLFHPLTRLKLLHGLL